MIRQGAFLRLYVRIMGLERLADVLYMLLGIVGDGHIAVGRLLIILEDLRLHEHGHCAIQYLCRQAVHPLLLLGDVLTNIAYHDGVQGLVVYIPVGLRQFFLHHGAQLFKPCTAAQERNARGLAVHVRRIQHGDSRHFLQEGNRQSVIRIRIGKDFINLVLDFLQLVDILHQGSIRRFSGVEFLFQLFDGCAHRLQAIGQVLLHPKNQLFQRRHIVLHEFAIPHSRVE